MEAKVKVKLEGEAEYKRALNNINQQNKTLNSELKKVKSSFNDNTTAQEKARKQTEVLTKQQTALKDKLALLQSQYDKVSKKYGENSTEALKLKDSMNKVETELNKVNNELSDCAKELNKTGDEAKESTSKFNKFKTAMNSLGVDTKSVSSKLNSFSNTLTKGLVAGCAAAVTGIAKLIKSSVELYGETEQLKGGIQKLYGEDFIKVLNNANNAYKTVGVSANTYMESVTKFSAALINSLGGDTVKAAELADVAMRAISDNANTFGTDIESLITTYQGFAKANYTMLDNLNLGFAGTRDGMQALLDKATEISGVKFDISSFSDIVQAIQIVQEQMGIAGTTAKEAATTIQGSLDSMSAAWQNLLAGLADPDADIGMLVDNMMNAASTAMKNLVPVIQRAAENIPKALKRAFPEARSEINALETGMQSFMKLVTKLSPLLKTLASNFGTVVKGIAGLAIASKVFATFKTHYDNITNMNVAMKRNSLETTANAKKQAELNAEIKQQELDLEQLTAKYREGTIAGKEYYMMLDMQKTNLSGLNDEMDMYKQEAKQLELQQQSNTKTMVSGWGSIISVASMAASTIIAVVGVVVQKFKEQVESVRELTEEEQALKDASDDVTEAIKSQRDEINKDRSATDSELNYIQKLNSELTTLVDANGKVSDANKARVQFILTEMNSALGTEYTLTDNLISGYGTLTGKVYELIEAKRQEVYMQGGYDKWKTAVQEQEGILEQSKESYAAYFNYINGQDYTEIEQKYKQYQQIMKEQSASDNPSFIASALAVYWEEKYNAAKEHADELYGVYRQDIKNYSQYTSDIENYEAAFAAQQAGDMTAMVDILKNGITEKTEKYRQSIKVEKEYTQAEIDEYVKRKNNALNKYAEIKAEYDKASETEKEALETKLQNALDEVTNTIDPDIDKAVEAGNVLGYAYIDGVITKIDEGTTDIENATTDAVDNATDKAADNASTGGTKVAANCIGGVTSALLGDKSISNSLVSILSNAISNGEQTGNTSTSIATAIIGAITGPIGSSYLLLNCLKNAVKGAKDNASGVDTSSVGKNMISGIGTGITNNEWSLKKTFWGSVSNAITWVKTKLGIQSPSKMMRDVIGKNLMLGLAEGIKVGTSDVIKASSVAMGKIATSFETPLTQNVKLDTDSMNSALQYNIKVANQTKDMELAFKSAMNGMAVVMDGDRFGSFVSDTVLYGRPNVEGVY